MVTRKSIRSSTTHRPQSKKKKRMTSLIIISINFLQEKAVEATRHQARRKEEKT
jgi:hypothetical protein